MQSPMEEGSWHLQEIEGAGEQRVRKVGWNEAGGADKATSGSPGSHGHCLGFHPKSRRTPQGAMISSLWEEWDAPPIAGLFRLPKLTHCCAKTAYIFPTFDRQSSWMRLAPFLSFPRLRSLNALHLLNGATPRKTALFRYNSCLSLCSVNLDCFSLWVLVCFRPFSIPAATIVSALLSNAPVYCGMKNQRTQSGGFSSAWVLGLRGSLAAFWDPPVRADALNGRAAGVGFGCCLRPVLYNTVAHHKWI